MSTAAAVSLAITDTDLKSAKEIIRDKLYFLALKKNATPRSTNTAVFFSIDTVLTYEPFFHDFGPLNLGNTYRFCELLKAKLANPKNEGKVIYFYCSPKQQHKSNAAVLIGAFQIICLGRTVADAYKPLESLEPFLPFRDASMGVCTFKLTVKHCLRALHKAIKLGFFNFDTFNVEEYEHYECVENGDLNVLIPGKFIACAGPLATNKGPDGFPAMTPDDYAPIFKKFHVSTIIRLNKKVYDRKKFVDQGFAHHDLYFIDGTSPSTAILDKFLQICETAPGTIVVHCKAGLGRTGTCIGCYIMKHYKFTAAEAIAWLRLCRPGSVIGPQQHFMKQQQARMWKAGGGKTQPLNSEREVKTRLPDGTAATAAGVQPSQQSAGAGAGALNASTGVSGVSSVSPSLSLAGSGLMSLNTPPAPSALLAHAAHSQPPRGSGATIGGRNVKAERLYSGEVNQKQIAQTATGSPPGSPTPSSPLAAAVAAAGAGGPAGAGAGAAVTSPSQQPASPSTLNSHRSMSPAVASSAFAHGSGLSQTPLTLAHPSSAGSRDRREVKRVSAGGTSSSGVSRPRDFLAKVGSSKFSRVNKDGARVFGDKMHVGFGVQPAVAAQAKQVRKKSAGSKNPANLSSTVNSLQLSPQPKASPSSPPSANGASFHTPPHRTNNTDLSLSAPLPHNISSSLAAASSSPAAHAHAPLPLSAVRGQRVSISSS